MHDSGEEYYEVDFLVHPDENENTTKTYQTFIDEANPIIILVREWEDAGGVIEWHIITTEKDYFKIKDFDIKKIEYLKVLLEINEKEKFIETILELYDKNN